MTGRFLIALLVISAADVLSLGPGWMDVTDVAYGARGDDTVFDDKAFASAIAASRSGKASSVVLHIPRGRYRFAKTLALPNWINVDGEGATSVLLDFAALDSGSVAIQLGGAMEKAHPGETVRYSGFTVFGPLASLSKPTNTVGIQVGSPPGQTGKCLALATLSNVDIKNFDVGIRLGDINYMNKFEHLYINTCRIGLLKEHDGREKDNGENLAFEHVIFGRNLLHFHIDPFHGGGFGLRFTGCSFDYARGTPEAVIGGGGVLVFDACHWETEQVGRPDEALLIRIVKPPRNLVFSNTTFVRKAAAPANLATPIQWHPDWDGVESGEMGLSFFNCNFLGFGTPLIWDARRKPDFRAGQPKAVVVASPRFSAAPDKAVLIGVESPGSGRLSLDTVGDIRVKGRVRFDSLPTAGAGARHYLCIDAENRVFRQKSPCN